MNFTLHLFLPPSLPPQVSAQDDDDGSFGVVYYTLIDGFGKFEINNMTGIISTIDTIDYEAPNEKSFSLSVVANDSAIPVSTQRLVCTPQNILVMYGYFWIFFDIIFFDYL